MERIMGMAMVVVMVVAAVSCHRADAQVHHVVGGDRGWEPSTNIVAWSSGRVFRVGDKIWFTYSAAEESIVELKSREEYESCDARNPIRMFTDGLNSIQLDGEGIRYFVSSKSENCKNGLRLHVEVMPPVTQNVNTYNGKGGRGSSASALAAAPSLPSALAAAPSLPSVSDHNSSHFALFLLGFFWFCYMGF